MNKILLTCLVVFFSTMSNAKVEKVEFEYCKDNADLLGYVLTIQSICELYVDQKNELIQYIQQTSKTCVETYGNKSMFNATKMGIFAVKAEMDDVGRNTVCASALQDYSEFFNFDR